MSARWLLAPIVKIGKVLCFLYTGSVMSSARFVGVGGRGLTPFWCLSTPKFVLTPRNNSQNKSKIHCWPPSGFPTNRVLVMRLLSVVLVQRQVGGGGGQKQILPISISGDYASGLKIGRSSVQISPKTNFSIMIKLPVKSTGK